MKNGLFVFLSATLLLAGCSQTLTGSDAPLLQHYQCAAGGSFDVSYLDQQSALLRVGGKQYTLLQVPAASGVKYVLDDKSNPQSVMLHTKGDEATLELSSTFYKACKIQ